MKNRTHSFDIDVAVDVGVNAAILYANILFWVAKNKANQKNNRDGLYWTYNSRRAFCELFPYLGDGAIRGALKRLVDKGYVVKGEYNLANYDRTGWYSVPLDKITNGLDELTSPLDKLANRLGENNQPIPDVKPDIKPDDASPSQILDYLNEATGSNFRSVKSNTKLVRARLSEGYDVDTIKQVIDAKVHEWSTDSKMSRYLRPSTLFSAENFANYAGQLSPRLSNPGGF